MGRGELWGSSALSLSWKLKWAAVQEGGVLHTEDVDADECPQSLGCPPRSQSQSNWSGGQQQIHQ